MFELKTSDLVKLRRIVACGVGALLLGFVLIGINLFGPLVDGGAHDATNVVFGLFGVLSVITATHLIYQAVKRLEEI
jgi:hypothetical protein